MAVINNLEFDHADIFDDLAQIQTSFRRMVNLIPGNGLLVANGDDLNVAELLEIDHCPVQRFGLGAGNEVRGEALKFSEKGACFEVGGAFSPYRWPVSLMWNALAVIAVARHCGLSAAQIQSAFETFQGIKRRMECGEVIGVMVIDDFAHHPTAIAETLRAVRVRFRVDAFGRFSGGQHHAPGCVSGLFSEPCLRRMRWWWPSGSLGSIARDDPWIRVLSWSLAGKRNRIAYLRMLNPLQPM